MITMVNKLNLMIVIVFNILMTCYKRSLLGNRAVENKLLLNLVYFIHFDSVTFSRLISKNQFFIT